MRVLPALAAAAVLAGGAACGGSEQAATMPLEAWQEEVCELARGVRHDDTAGFAGELRGLVADVRALPPPAGREEDAGRFAELLEGQAARIEEGAPRLDEAVRRWNDVVERLDPDGELPRTAEEALAGGIPPEAMARLLADPEAAEAVRELTERLQAPYASEEARQVERAAEGLGVHDCSVEIGAPRSSSHR